MSHTVIRSAQKMGEEVVVTTFYKFFDQSNLAETQVVMLGFMSAQGILGTILLGTEGINGTISGNRVAIDAFYVFIEHIAGNMLFKETYCNFMPFGKLKVKIKKEIVTAGVKLESDAGLRINPKDWDEAILADDTIVIDTRNDYEYYIGTFEGAINPNIRSFRALPEWIEQNITDTDKEKKILMFCTGGIRCEKSTAFMKDRGFDNVYHLDGGIIGYLIAKQGQEKTWRGNCFVFDDRVIIDENLQS